MQRPRRLRRRFYLLYLAALLVGAIVLWRVLVTTGIWDLLRQTYLTAAPQPL